VKTTTTTNHLHSRLMLERQRRAAAGVPRQWRSGLILEENGKMCPPRHPLSRAPYGASATGDGRRGGSEVMNSTLTF
jgi:hypothetical protein